MELEQAKQLSMGDRLIHHPTKRRFIVWSENYWGELNFFVIKDLDTEELIIRTSNDLKYFIYD